MSALFVTQNWGKLIKTILTEMKIHFNLNGNGK